MSSSPRVTVVVPIYNVEDYLVECLDSILGQTALHLLTVVLVDDGSTDDSGRIADDFVTRFPDVFRVIHQDNAGLGAARNTGLDLVETEFVTFLDSDDLLPAAAIEAHLSALDANVEAELSIGRMQAFPQPVNWPWLKHLTRDAGSSTTLLESPELVHGPSACNKVFRSDFVRALNLRFAVGSHFEDVPFTVTALLASRRLAIAPIVVYLYRKRTDGSSIMDGVWRRKSNYWDHLAVNSAVVRLCPHLSPDLRRVRDLFFVRSLQGFLWRAPQVLEGDVDAYFAMARELVGHVDDDTLLDGCLDLRHRLPYLALRADSLHDFVDVLGTIEDIDAEDGNTVVVLTHRLGPVSPSVRSAKRLTAHLEAVDRLPRGAGLRFTGSVAIDGLAPRRLPGGRLAVRVRGSGVTTPVMVVKRQRQIGSTLELVDGGFVVDVVRGRLRPGRHNLRLVVMGESGQASRNLQPTTGLLRSRRSMPLRGRTASIATDRWNNTLLEVLSPPRGRRAVLAHRTRLLRDAISDLLARKPLAGWRVVRLITSPAFRRRRPWILAERRDTAQDNSYVLFRYLRETHPDIPAVYVIDRSSPHLARLSGYRGVVVHSSWRHRLLMTHAAWLISSYDIDAYLLPDQWSRQTYLTHLAPWVASRRAFLQHGVIYNDIRTALRRAVTGLDLFVASSHREADYLRATTGYNDEVVVTGLPRFDTLTRTAHKSYVLFMPTWRTYLGTPSYRKSTAEVLHGPRGERYLSFVRGLLQDRRLNELLTRHDVEFRVLPHYEVSKLLATEEVHSSVTFVDQGRADIQEQIRGAALVVTDWSSVFFDAARVGAPVVHTPFDEDDPDGRPYRAGYFDLRRDGFGPVAVTVDETVDAIQRYIRNGFCREEAYTERVQEFFASTPAAACSAVVEALVSRSSWPRTLPRLEDYGDRL